MAPLSGANQNERNRTTLTAECVSAGSEPSDVLTSFKERVMMQPYIAIVWPEYPVGVAPTYSVLKTAAELTTDGYVPCRRVADRQVAVK